MQRIKMIGRSKTRQWVLSTMTRRNWKYIYPTNQMQAMELCTEYARDKLNKSIERIAEDMGLPSHHTLYKWLATGRMPLIYLRPFEMACGVNFVTKYIARSSGLLVLDIPTGRRASHREINDLSLFMNQAIQQLYEYEDGKCSAHDATSTITELMEDLAHQRGNIEKDQQPDLHQLFDNGEDE